MNDNVWRNTWLGRGVKYGGQLIAAGMESVDGTIFCAANPNWEFQFGVTNARLGPGLGGGVGAVAVFGFNIPSIMAMDGTELSDWGVNLSLGGKWKDVAKGLLRWKYYKVIAELGVRAANVPKMGKDLEGMKLAVHYLWNAMDIGSRGGKPVLAMVDLPIGSGYEVSIVYTTGKFNIIN